MEKICEATKKIGGNVSDAVFVIGGVNMDIIGEPFEPLIAADSNPGRVRMSFGGVGRNIAENLVRLGENVQLVTALGKKGDNFAAAHRAHCREMGIGLDYVIETDEPSGVYLVVHAQDGDMYVAVCDSMALDRLEFASIPMRSVNEGKAIVLDTNLPEETLKRIAQAARIPIFLDPISTHKAMRIKGILSRLYLIKPNLLEACALTGLDPDAPDAPEKSAQALVDAGVEHAFVSLGKAGLIYRGASGRGFTVPSATRHDDIVCATGAGDAVTAALTAGLINGLSPEKCAVAAMRAARLTAMCAETVCPELTANIFN